MIVSHTYSIRNLRLSFGIFSMVLLGVLSPQPSFAFVEALSTATEKTSARVEAFGSYAVPIGPWADGSMLTSRIEGRIEQSAWRIADGRLSTLAMISPLRDALAADGWQILYECETESCGGFDFRYSTQVLPEPLMHVDLGDFRFVSARRGRGEEREHMSFLVSRSSGAGAGYVQMIHVLPENAGQRLPPISREASLTPSTPQAGSELGAPLEAGSLVLEGVRFDTGAASVILEDEAQMRSLVEYLRANPRRSIALVGHTDASGAAEVNLDLSRRRAEAVRERLVKDFGAPAGRVQALGAGLMAPRASNQTEEGRALNRRVEVILTSTN